MGMNRQIIFGALSLIVLLLLGQITAFFLAPGSWQRFSARLPVIIAILAFRGPIFGIISAFFVTFTMRLLSF